MCYLLATWVLPRRTDPDLVAGQWVALQLLLSDNTCWPGRSLRMQMGPGFFCVDERPSNGILVASGGRRCFTHVGLPCCFWHERSSGGDRSEVESFNKPCLSVRRWCQRLSSALVLRFFLGGLSAACWCGRPAIALLSSSCRSVCDARSSPNDIFSIGFSADAGLWSSNHVGIVWQRGRNSIRWSPNRETLNSGLRRPGRQRLMASRSTSVRINKRRPHRESPQGVRDKGHSALQGAQ